MVATSFAQFIPICDGNTNYYQVKISNIFVMSHQFGVGIRLAQMVGQGIGNQRPGFDSPTGVDSIIDRTRQKNR